MATAQSSLYEELQTAYLYNFAKYVKWPEERETFVIGIYGEPENLASLQVTLERKQIRGKSIVVKVLTDVEEIQTDNINIVYVPEGETQSFASLIDATAGKNVLVVTGDDMIRKGAAISFIIVDDKLKFKLKRSALKSAGLVASDALLKLSILL